MSKTLTLPELLQELSNAHVNPLKRAQLMQEQISLGRVSKTDLARLIKKSPSFVSNHLRLLNLPTVVKDALLSKIISEGHARALSFLEERSEMLKLFEDTIRFNYSVRDVERKVNNLRQSKRAYGKVSAELEELRSAFQKKTNLNSTLHRKKSAYELTITFPEGVAGSRQLVKLLRELLAKS